MDDVGYGITLFDPWVSVDKVASLATQRSYTLRSSFRPSYNMAVNLVNNYDRSEAEHLINSSFGQFQADRDVVKLEQTRERNEAYLATYREKMTCEKGDILEYRDLLDRLKKLEGSQGRGARRSRVADAVSRLERGDVIEIATGKRRGLYAIVDVVDRASDRRPRILAISAQRSLLRLGPADFREEPRKVGRVDVPRGFDARDAAARRQVARGLRSLDLSATEESNQPTVEDLDEIRSLKRSIARHPVHGCAERGRHMHFADRAARLERELRSLDRRISRRTATLARRFDRVVEVLEERGYVESWALTGMGELLTRIYNESDLLVAEAVEKGLLDGLGAADIAALCSALVYEARGPEPSVYTPMPTAATRRAFARLMKLWSEIHKAEEQRGLDLTRTPDAGFAGRIHAWASGTALDEVLDDEDAPGDFVRVTKQLIDLLRQLATIATSHDLRTNVERSVGAVNRSVVAYSSLQI